MKSESQAQKIAKPSIFRFMGENVKVWIELWRARTFRKSYQVTKIGDGHPVLVIPGFLASDLSSYPIRKFIREQGYSPYPWGMGRNFGDIRQLKKLVLQIEQLYAKHETPVSLIGWSLGGVYARQLAKENPTMIRQVITLASPFAGINEPNNASWMYRLLNDHRPISPAEQQWIDDLPNPPAVPTTALYSKEDGVVPWQTCMEPKEDHLHQNIEVTGGHFGMGYNPATLLVIADRLQLQANSWKAFTPQHPLPKTVIFPSNSER